MPQLLDALFWVAVGACVVAQAYILVGVLRVSPDTTASATVSPPRRATEIFWAVLPALFLAGVFALAWRAMHPSS